jgi:hypothetical protein
MCSTKECVFLVACSSVLFGFAYFLSPTCKIFAPASCKEYANESVFHHATTCESVRAFDGKLLGCTVTTSFSNLPLDHMKTKLGCSNPYMDAHSMLQSKQTQWKCEPDPFIHDVMLCNHESGISSCLVLSTVCEKECECDSLHKITYGIVGFAFCLFVVFLVFEMFSHSDEDDSDSDSDNNNGDENGEKDKKQNYDSNSKTD